MSFIIIPMFLIPIIFMFLNHPLSFSLTILGQTILISLITGTMTYNYWYSYIIFLVMVGGMLILFIYMTNVASNEKLKLSYKLSYLSLMFMFLSLTMILIDQFYMNMPILENLFNQNMQLNFKLSLNKFLNWPLNMNFYLMIIYLLITLIMVVKITDIQYGPLRQKL